MNLMKKVNIRFSNILFVVMFLLMVSSCQKPAGEGGKATIYGKIWAQEWNSSYTVMNGEHAGMDEDVYIVYGDDVNYGDKQTTNYNGEFEFKYLRKGKYKIYLYSLYRPSKTSGGDSAVVREVEIKNNTDKIDLGTITIYKK